MQSPSRWCLLLAVLVFVPGAAAGDGDETAFDVQGHRGARGLLPENTLVGFGRAIELGVTTLELDLGVTRDGEVVVAHDPYLNPKLCLTPTGEPLAGERGPLLKHLDLLELQAFDCGSLNPDIERFPEPPRRNVPGERVPTLREVFELVRERGASGLRFNLEVKSRPNQNVTVPLETFVAKVVALVQEEGVLTRTTLQAFDWRVLEIAKRLEPRLRTAALLAELDPAWQAGLDAAKQGGVLGMLRAADASIDDFSPYWPMLVEGEGGYAGVSVAEYQAAGFAVVPWTINSRARMRQFIDLGVDGIITDYPDRLIEVLEEGR